MQHILKQLAVADPQKRRTALLDCLRAIDAPFQIETIPVGRYTPENIRVVLQPGSPRLLIGAHYDAVPDSTGANDNAAGVTILLHLLQNFLSQPDRLHSGLPLEFVFFDLEEAEMQGSLAYLQTHRPADILGLINVDLCGVGDVVLVADNLLPADTQQILQTAARQFSFVRRVSHLPPSDDYYFEALQVPTLSICSVPEQDIKLMQEIALALRGEGKLTALPTVFETMHNRSHDSLSSIDIVAMQQVYQFLSALLNRLLHQQ